MGPYAFATHGAGVVFPPGQVAAPPALDAALHALAQALIPPPELETRDEQVRQRVEWVMQSRWRDARVAIFGSANSGLRVGLSSDVDLCVIIPSYEGPVKRTRQTRRRAPLPPATSGRVLQARLPRGC